MLKGRCKDSYHSHSFQPWCLRLFRPPSGSEPAMRLWIRQCGHCSTLEYRRLDGDVEPDDNAEVSGLLFLSQRPCV